MIEKHILNTLLSLEDNRERRLDMLTNIAIGTTSINLYKAAEIIRDELANQESENEVNELLGDNPKRKNRENRVDDDRCKEVAGGES